MKDEKILNDSGGAPSGNDRSSQFDGNANATNQGTFNTALGYQSGYSVTTGNYSTFIGYSASYSVGITPHNEVTVKREAQPLVILSGCDCLYCKRDIAQDDIEGHYISSLRKVGTDLYVHCPEGMHTGCPNLANTLIPFDFDDIRVHNLVHDSVLVDVPLQQLERAKKFLEAQFRKEMSNPFVFRMPSMLGDAL